jgi:hypothetical protein
MDLSHIDWRKASYSSNNGGECVEVAAVNGTDLSCLVRDSKDPDGPRLALSPAAWRAFTRRLKHGRQG